MRGDSRLGVVLCDLRTTRGLSLRAVTRQVGCNPSVLSRVETGHRRLSPWLATALDRLYATGTMIASLVPTSGGTPRDSPGSGIPRPDLFVVILPQGGVTMPVSRREVTASLGLGIVAGPLQSQFERALDSIKLDGDVLASSQAALDGFKEAIRVSPPARLMDAMTGQVAVLDGLRRRTDGAQRRQYSTLAAHYAESLSWLSEEAGDLPSALWWIDRASHWAQAAGWINMTAFMFVRRSMVTSFSNDGLRVVDQVRPVLEMPQASPRMKGFAANRMASGYALAGQRDESRRAMDAAMDYLAQPVREDDAALSQLHVASDDLLATYQATCDVYLGYGARVIPVLEPRLASLATSSFRRATITRAKLARAYANAGQPEQACRLAWETLEAIEQIDSQSARSELRRALPLLVDRWHGRSDVQEVAHRLAPPAAATAEA
ncbi:MAG: helix-turn-helix domain-containing protein [Pseudonocardiales bacterium]|nr:helix-turn-helix domain-containing protein [Pseudonocardiales bacterium]